MTTFNAGIIRLLPDARIVRIDFLPETHVTLGVARDEIAALKRLTGGRRLPVLCNFENVVSTDLAARMYYGGTETRSAYSAAAFVTKSPMTKAIGNVFLAFQGRSSMGRVRLFDTEHEALAWLSTHLSSGIG